MMADGLQLRIDANQFKEDVKDILDIKFRGITTDNKLYSDISHILVDEYLKPLLLGPDTGAARDQTKGNIPTHVKNNYPRYGYLKMSRSDGIKWDAFERRKTSDKHYIGYLLAQAVDFKEDHGVEDGRDIEKGLKDSGLWEDFLQDCKPKIIEAMNRVKK